MQNLRALILALVFLLTSAVSARAGDKMPLWQHWEPGKIYHFESQTHNEQISDGPADRQFSTAVIMQLEVTVTQEPGSDRTLARVKYVSYKSITTIDGNTTVTDTGDPKVLEGPLGRHHDAFTGKSVTLVFDKGGAFVDAIAGPNALQLEGRTPKEIGDRVWEIWRRRLPGRELAMGEAIDFNARGPADPPIDEPRRVHLESLVTHEGRKHAKVVIELPSAAAVPGRPGRPPLQQERIETLFDLERRSVTRSTLTRERKPMGSRIPGQKTTSTITLKSIEDAPKVRVK